MPRTTDAVTFSLPPVLRRELKRVAKKEGRSQSEVLRDAFRFWRDATELDRLQRIGETIAVRLGIETDDDVARYLTRRSR